MAEGSWGGRGVRAGEGQYRWSRHVIRKQSLKLVAEGLPSPPLEKPGPSPCQPPPPASPLGAPPDLPSCKLLASTAHRHNAPCLPAPPPHFCLSLPPTPLLPLPFFRHLNFPRLLVLRGLSTCCSSCLRHPSPRSSHGRLARGAVQVSPSLDP